MGDHNYVNQQFEININNLSGLHMLLLFYHYIKLNNSNLNYLRLKRSSLEFLIDISLSCHTVWKREAIQSYTVCSKGYETKLTGL